MCRAIALLMVGVSCLYAQTPQFEVAAIRPSPPRTTAQVRRGCSGGPGTADPDRWTCNNEFVINLVRMAYDLKPYQFDPPDWMRTSMFDVTAKIPTGAAKEHVPLMLRSLLVERFKLASHFGKKEMEIYEMTIGPGGPKFKEWVDDPPAGDKDQPRSGPIKSVDIRLNTSFADGEEHMDPNGRHARKAKQSMDELAGFLSGSSYLERPVINATGLTGTFKIMLDWVKERVPTPLTVDGEPYPLADGPTLFKAVESQLGLKLESKKSMVDVLVIDHMEKTPTEN